MWLWLVMILDPCLTISKLSQYGFRTEPSPHRAPSLLPFRPGHIGP